MLRRKKINDDSVGDFVHISGGGSLFGRPPPESLADIVTKWTSEQVADWLRGVDEASGQYAPIFLHWKVDGRRLASMTASDLADIGVRSVGVRATILQAIQVLLDTVSFIYSLQLSYSWTF